MRLYIYLQNSWQISENLNNNCNKKNLNKCLEILPQLYWEIYLQFESPARMQKAIALSFRGIPLTFKLYICTENNSTNCSKWSSRILKTQFIKLRQITTALEMRYVSHQPNQIPTEISIYFCSLHACGNNINAVEIKPVASRMLLLIFTSAS